MKRSTGAACSDVNGQRNSARVTFATFPTMDSAAKHPMQLHTLEEAFRSANCAGRPAEGCFQAAEKGFWKSRREFGGGLDCVVSIGCLPPPRKRACLLITLLARLWASNLSCTA